jgi:thiamine-monophosphate kinase
VIGRISSPTRILRRDGARPGWQIGVTGTLGGAAAGLRLLETGRRPAAAADRRWVRAQLDPQPRIDAGRALVGAGVRVGGDISDGLYREVQRITEPSRLGATIGIRQLPLASGLNASQWPLAVEDSEDFELLCAAPAARMASAKTALRRLGLPLTVVGQIDREPGIRLLDGTHLVRVRRPGYEHFR